VRPITAGKCVCDGYTVSTKVRPVTCTCDTGWAQDNRAWWQHRRGEAVAILVALVCRVRSDLKLQTSTCGRHQKKKAALAIAKDELFIEKP